MSKIDAYKLLASEVARLRGLGYKELSGAFGESSRLVRAVDSIVYTVYVTVKWRDGRQGDIAVNVTVATADCGPLERFDESFVISPGR
jgi:hypothetical protein